jgi:hypothetical protein
MPKQQVLDLSSTTESLAAAWTAHAAITVSAMTIAQWQSPSIPSSTGSAYVFRLTILQTQGRTQKAKQIARGVSHLYWNLEKC